jgi:squalene-associated FAD-dependent desaturase
MTAAWRLTQRGYAVTLIERRPYLGGRAYSFVDRETGEQVDNGQHVFLGCCTAYASLLRDIGTLELTSRQRRLRVEVRSPNGTTGVLSGLPLPAPLHLLPSFFRYPHIGWRDKLRAVPALLRIQREKDRDRGPLRAISFHDWLRRNGQSPRAIANFWDLIVLPALNDSSANVAASMGFMIFQEAMLRNPHGGDVGFARAGLSDIMGEPIERKLEAANATLKLGRTAERLIVDDGPAGRVAGIELAGGETVTAHWYVSAVPPDVLLDMLPEGIRHDPAFAPAATHTWSPIVNLHIWYDRPVADFDFVAFVETPVQWVFNRTRIAGLPGPGQYLTVSLSGAWDFWPMTKEELREKFIPELSRLLPAARDANVDRFIVIKEQRATFRTPPDAPPNRLPATTPLPNLVLAGDWTDTGWPATMEGAVRSGNTATQAVESLRASAVARPPSQVTP